MSFLEHPKLGGLNSLLAIVIVPLVLYAALVTVGIVKPLNAPTKILEVREVGALENNYFVEDTMAAELHKPPQPHPQRQFYLIFSLVNTGNQPIAEGDFSGNNGVMTPPPNRIERVYPGNPYGIDGMGVYSQWTSTNNRDWFFAHQTINANDHLDFTVVLDLDPALSKKPEIDPTSVLRWAFNIAGLTSPIQHRSWIVPPPNKVVGPDQNIVQLNFFNSYSFAYENNSVWLFLGLSFAVFFITLCVLFVVRRNHYPHPAVLALLVVMLLFYSFALSEIAAYLTLHSLRSLDRICYVILPVGIISLIVLFWHRPEPRPAEPAPAEPAPAPPVEKPVESPPVKTGRRRDKGRRR